MEFLVNYLIEIVHSPLCIASTIKLHPSDNTNTTEKKKEYLRNRELIDVFLKI